MSEGVSEWLHLRMSEFIASLACAFHVFLFETPPVVKCPVADLLVQLLLVRLLLLLLRRRLERANRGSSRMASA